MRKVILKKNCCMALAVALLLGGTTPVLGSKSAWAGNGNKNWKHEKKENYEHSKEYYYEPSHRESRGDVHIYFNDHQRTVVHRYYTDQFSKGHCPPGLAKKHNGCAPPGLARTWRVGHPLPREVVYYDVPPAVVVQLGPAPAGHRYVRVASDILLMAVGTGMIVDAIQDLSHN